MESICHCLPLAITPRGHTPHAGLQFAAGHAHGSGGNSGFLCIEEDWRPQGRPCVDIVFGCFERCYLRHGGGDGPINHRVIETAPVIIHLGPLILADVRWVFFLIFHLDFCFGKVAYGEEWTHPSSGLRYSVQIGSIQTIYDSKVILLAQVKLEIFQAQLWDVEWQHINLECTGRNQKVACHMRCQ